MGLLYIMPASVEEVDRVTVDNQTITLKSYGLPMIFWGYLAAILFVVFCLALASNDVLLKLVSTDDTINRTLAISVYFLLYVGPIILLLFYFYEKVLIKSGTSFTIIHKIFWIPVKKKSIELKSKDSIKLEHFLDSPNMARINNHKDMKGFINRGYFSLFAVDSNDNWIFLDRQNQKRDLEKLKNLLSSY